MVIGQHLHGGKLQRVSGFHLRMRHLYPSVEDCGLSEDHVFRIHLVLGEGILAIDEPDEVHHPAAAVGEVGHHTFLPAVHLEGFKA